MQTFVKDDKYSIGRLETLDSGIEGAPPVKFINNKEFIKPGEYFIKLKLKNLDDVLSANPENWFQSAYKYTAFKMKYSDKDKKNMYEYFDQGTAPNYRQKNSEVKEETPQIEQNPNTGTLGAIMDFSKETMGKMREGDQELLKQAQSQNEMLTKQVQQMQGQLDGLYQKFSEQNPAAAWDKVVDTMRTQIEGLNDELLEKYNEVDRLNREYAQLLTDTKSELARQQQKSDYLEQLMHEKQRLSDEFEIKRKLMQDDMEKEGQVIIDQRAKGLADEFEAHKSQFTTTDALIKNIPAIISGLKELGIFGTPAVPSLQTGLQNQFQQMAQQPRTPSDPIEAKVRLDLDALNANLPDDAIKQIVDGLKKNGYKYEDVTMDVIRKTLEGEK